MFACSWHWRMPAEHACQQSHRLWSHVLGGLLVDRITPTGTQRRVRQSHIERIWICLCKPAGAELAESARHPPQHLCGSADPSAPSVWPWGLCLVFVPLAADHHHTVVFGFHRAIQAPLDVRGHREEVPDSSVMVCFLPPEPDAQRAGSLGLHHAPCPHIPPRHRPTLPIDLHWWHCRPDVPALHIHPMPRGFPSLTAVWFGQCQHPWRSGLLLLQPLVGALTCCFDHPSDLPHTALDLMQVLQACASITSVRTRVGSGAVFCVVITWFPNASSNARAPVAVQRDTRRNGLINSCGAEPLSGPPCERAPQRCPMDPVSSPLNGGGFQTFAVSLRDSLCLCLFSRHVSPWFMLVLNHA